ncbi:MAG: hypothetical protein HY000_06415 [Planctomycetes bacterium]|nr:hypothetical protein [Planctomycetota bacterium]
MRWLVLIICACCCLSRSGKVEASAQQLDQLAEEVQRLRQLVEQLQTTVQAQQQRLAEFESVRSQPARLVPSAAQAGSLERQATSSLSAFNPEIGVVADVVGQFTESSRDGEGNDKLSVRELELVFGHPIDPYSRLDATITFSDFEEPALEEAYITHWGLPGELKARLGRLKPKVGKAVAIHRDSLDTVDEPLVVDRYFGHEGLSRTGAEFSGFLPLPWTVVTHELTAGIIEGGIGEGGKLFGQTRRRPSFYAHLKNFWDVTDTTNAEVGVTYLGGSKDEDANVEVNALGVDATLVHFVTPTNKLKWQNEAYFQHRRESLSVADNGRVTDFEPNPWGVYSLVDYRLSPRVGVGGRWDYVQPVDLDPLTLVRHADTAWSGYLTFSQSEFSRWRLQYRHTDFAAGGDDNSVFLQGTVAIGVHKHALQ